MLLKNACWMISSDKHFYLLTQIFKYRLELRNVLVKHDILCFWLI